MDHAATTRPFPEVLEAMLPFYGTYYGNASSGYELGADSRAAVEQARSIIAASLRAKPEQIFFTSGGTEGNNWVLRGTSVKWRNKGSHIITTQIEHPAVLKTCRQLERRGVRVTYLKPDSRGTVSPDQVRKAITEETVLISVMAANNEIGTLEPIREIGAIAARAGVLFHTDAVQVYGHLPLWPERIHADFITASAHKFGGPKGIGFVYVRDPKLLEPYQTGGGQERGMRAGTENVPGIVGMGKAAEISCRHMEENTFYVSRLREYLSGRIMKEFPQALMNGHPVHRLPGNVHICLPGLDGAALTAVLDLDGICVSSASACSSSSPDPSHVLLAIGRSAREAYGAVRITLGPENTKEEIDFLIEKMKKAAEMLKE